MTSKLSERILIGVACLPLGIATIAYAILKTPFAIECLNVDVQSEVSARIHCAQLKAERRTPESLVSAIELIGNTPVEDPHHEEGKRLIERWSIELLNQAEVAFQAGNLERAIDIAKSLPAVAPNAHLVTERVRAWKITWTRAEVLEQAFQLANRLRQLGNEYWETERRTALVEQIQSDRELRDWRLKQPVVAAKPKQIPLAPPKKPIARTRPPLWEPKDDATPVRPAEISVPAEAIAPPPIAKPESQTLPPEVLPDPVLPTPEPTPEVELVTPVVEIETGTQSSLEQP